LCSQARHFIFSASLHPDVGMGTCKLNAKGSLMWCRPHFGFVDLPTLPWSLISKVHLLKYILPLHTQSKFQVHLNYTYNSSSGRKPTIMNEITILYNGGCRNTYFETKRSGGNDEQNKLNKEKIKWVYLGYKFHDSSRL